MNEAMWPAKQFLGAHVSEPMLNVRPWYRSELFQISFDICNKHWEARATTVIGDHYEH